MYAEPFEYRRAASVDEAIELLTAAEGARPLAGGQALIPLLKKREVAPGTLVDISGIDAMRGIERTEAGARIGALTTHRQITNSPLLSEVAPALPAAVSKITGGIQVHNVATIGGNIARAHPAYDYPGALLASGANVRITGPDGTQSVPVSQFFQGACQTCLEQSQLVTAVEIDSQAGELCGGYAKKKEPASGGSIIGVATELRCESAERDRVLSARIGVNGLQASPVRLGAVETALSGSALGSETVETAAAAAGEELDSSAILDNKKASAAYRETLVTPYVRRSISKALST